MRTAWSGASPRSGSTKHQLQPTQSAEPEFFRTGREDVVLLPRSPAMHRSVPLLALLALASSVPGVAAQDVEMLGRRYGTPLPPSRRAGIGADGVDGFQFSRAWGGRRAERALFDGAVRAGPAFALGQRNGPVEGTFAIPVVLGSYSNTGPLPLSQSDIQDSYFSGAPGTITSYYTEVSGGRVTVQGDVLDWVQAPRPDSVYTVGESGIPSPHPSLGGGGAGNFVYDLLGMLPPIDWGLYDNDGPDGMPNSGDDDGFVDVLTVIHPHRGGECGGSGGGDRIWSHRWSLRSAVGTFFATNTTRFGGAGSILIDDYTIQPVLSCSGGGLNEIGVFTHELGHAFGLPDLYDACTDSDLCPLDLATTAGAGVWDLMATGSWGCNNQSPATPCHLGAWSKAVLGWVDVVTLAPDTDHGSLTLPPVETSGTVYRVDATDGSGEYFLLENRQRFGYDVSLLAEGLLVWQIDPDWVSSRWAINRVNANEHMGVWLRQADGRDDLGSGTGRGDAGDPFPGQTGNPAFHAGTTPAPYSFGGGVTGLTVLDIERVSDDVVFRLLTRRTTVTLTPAGTSASDGLFTVNGSFLAPPATTFSSAPFVQHIVEAAAGEIVQPGVRRPFVEWVDEVLAPRERTITTPLADTTFIAQFGGTQFELELSLSGGVNGVSPGSVSSTPTASDFWFEENTPVKLVAVPETGFSFAGWTGALAGADNPAAFSMSAPMAATAAFNLVYAIPATTVQFPAATPLDVQLLTENGTAPFTWAVVSGALPFGLVASSTGRITGSSFDLGTFAVTFQAVDGIGLPATGEVSIEMLAPDIPIERLTSPFLLSGPPLTETEAEFLNLQGNGVGSYDLGDFRAWLLANPELPLSAAYDGAPAKQTLKLRMSSRGGGG